jgi:glycosyltransferase involved in cell wall biosynthesis
MPTASPDEVLILVPAFNEAGAISAVVREIHAVLGDIPVLVVDDGSSDGTGLLAQRAGAMVLTLPVHLGLGGCVQAGYKLAYQLNYQYVVRIDGDGQHDPRDISAIVDELRRSGCEMVIGSRFAAGRGAPASVVRGIGIRLFRGLLRILLGQAVSDPTSGFVGVNRRALQLFWASFPLEYPEIEALVVLQRCAFRFREIPCRMRPRLAGHSTLTPMRSVFYVIHVLLGVFVNILRWDARQARRRLWNVS